MVWVNAESLNETPAGSVFAFGNAYIKAYTKAGLTGTAEPIQNTVPATQKYRTGWIIAGIIVILGICGYYFIRKKKKEVNND